MKISVVPWVGADPGWPPPDLAEQIVVVIDVLRATSTIVTALANGAKAVVPMLTPDEARSLAQPDDLLAGERGSLPLPGFALGNSPLEFTAERVAGKRIILTTTNGTRALLAAKGARRVLLASLLNMGAVADELKKDLARSAAFKGEAFPVQGDNPAREDIPGKVTFLCSGTRGRFSLEDTLCAGGIISRLLGETQEIDPDLVWGLVTQPSSTNPLTSLRVVDLTGPGPQGPGSSAQRDPGSPVQREPGSPEQREPGRWHRTWWGPGSEGRAFSPTDSQGRLAFRLDDSAYQLDDLAYAALFLYRTVHHSRAAFRTILGLGVNGRDLEKLGLAADIAYCAQEDLFSLCPEYRDDEVLAVHT